MLSRKKLKSAFFCNSVSRFVFKNAPDIAAYGFTACSAALIAKGGVHPDLESATGFMWLISNATLKLAKKHPDLAYRLNGAGTIAGALLLSASGVHGQHTDWWKTISPILGYGPPGCLIMFQKEIADFADKYKDSKSKLVRNCAQVLRYPIIASAIIEVCGSAGVLKSAFNNHRLWDQAIFSAAILTDGALAASDPRMQEEFRKENDARGSAPGASPVVV